VDDATCLSNLEVWAHEEGTSTDSGLSLAVLWLAGRGDRDAKAKDHKFRRMLCDIGFAGKSGGWLQPAQTMGWKVAKTRPPIPRSSGKAQLGI
jgi:hypothetical protein